ITICGTPFAWVAVHAYRSYKGVRTVTCPETRAPAVVRLDVARAVRTQIAGKPDLRLRSCSRWPERRGCPQKCLSQVPSARPCRVQTFGSAPRRSARTVGHTPRSGSGRLD